MALRIYERGGMRQHELHCRVLARQTSSAIARIVGLTTDIVETYKALFFDVEDRLDAYSYIVFQIAGKPLTGPPSIHTLMMLCAYYRGPLLVDAFFDYLAHAHEVNDLATQEGRRREAIELLIAAHELSSEDATRWRLVKLMPQIMEKRPKMFRTRSVDQVFSEITMQILAELPWSTASTHGTAAAGKASKASQKQPGDGRPGIWKVA